MRVGGIKQNLIKKSVKLVAAVALFLVFFATPSPTLALTEEEKLNQLNSQIQNTNKKLNETKSQKKNLQGEIAFFDRQIGDVQAQLNSTAAQISRLNSDITSTTANIAAAEAKLAETRAKLSEYLRAIYENGQISTIELIASSKSFSEFVDRTEYMDSIQGSIKDTADQVIGIKSQLLENKKALEEKKKKNEELKTHQAAQKNELATQKSSKNYLLEITRGDEAEYQALVAKLRKQYEELQYAIWSKNSGGAVSGGPVKKGQIIGYIGNSGFSSGPHLHFEIRTGNCYGCQVNPANYIGNGYFIHPVPGVRVSQPYGYTNWWAYSFHTGIDYADGGKGTPVRASADGVIEYNGGSSANTYPGGPLSYGHYIKIRHTNGMYSLYAHLR